MTTLERLKELLEHPDLRGDWHARGCYVYRTSDPRDTRQVCRVPAPASDDPYHKHPVAEFVALAQQLVKTL